MVTAAFAALAGSTAHAQSSGEEIEFGSSPNPVGSGARALGIGSAFIATADDATAASWNPAGLIALERPEASIVLSLKNRNEAFEGVGIAPGNEVQTFTYVDLNYVSAAFPFKIGSRFFVASLNYQTLIDFDKTIERTYFSSGEGLRAESDVVFSQSGSLRAIAPALAFQISPRLAVGFTVNFWTDMIGYPNGYRQVRDVDRTVVLSIGPVERTVVDTLHLDETFSYNGISGNFGFLWDVTPKWTVGGVFKTPVWGTLTHTVESFQKRTCVVSVDNPLEACDAPLEDVIDTPIQYEESYNMPLSYGLGVSYRHSDELTLSADVYRTEWSLFKHRLTQLPDETRTSINPISGRPNSESSVDGTIQAHLGGEYLFILPSTVVPVRGGVFYDPEPADGEPEHFLGFAVGTGVSIEQLPYGDLVLDVAYQFRAAIDAEPATAVLRGAGGTVTTEAQGGQIWQHLLYLSAIYHL